MELFADHRQSQQPATSEQDSAERLASPWKVLLIDDDEQMHQVTKLALSDFEFEGRHLELISAFSATEAKGIFQNSDDIALALVDVVMEPSTRV